MAAKVDIVFDTIYRGRGALKAERDLKDLNKEIDKGRESLERNQEAARKYSKVLLGIGVAAGAATVAAIKHGAEVQTNANRFDALTGSIGASADVLLGNMREATRYISDSELMRGANELINVGIAGNAEEVGRFSSVIGGLGLDMQQLTLTVVNQSKMRLDALGLSVADVDAKYNQLRKTLPDEEAWKIAVLESLEDKMLLLGDAVSDGEVAMRQFEAQMKNFADSAKIATATGFTPMIQELTTLSQLLGGTGDLTEDFGAAIAQQSGPFVNILQNLQALTTAYQQGDRGLFNFVYIDDVLAARSAERLRELRSEVTDFGGDLQALNQMAFEEHNRNLEEQATRARGSSTALERLDSVTGAWGETMARGNEHVEASIHFQRQAAEARARQIAAVEEHNSAMGALFGTMADTAPGDMLINSTDAQAEALYEAARAGDANALTLAILGKELGIFTGAQAEAALKSAALQIKIEELGRLIAEEKIGIPEAMGEIDAFLTELNNTNGTLSEIARQTGVVQEGFEGLDGREFSVDFVTRYREEGTRPPGIPDTTQGGTRDQAYAVGTPSLQGRGMVGELGPEMVLGSGQRVVSTNQTRNVTNNMTLQGRAGARALLNHHRRSSRPNTIVG